MSHPIVSKGPEFTRFMLPLLKVLKDLGGSATAAEAKEAVIARLEIPEKELSVQLKGGQSRIENQIAWARFHLAKTGYIDSSSRGLWTLTEKGLEEKLSPEEVPQIFRDVQKSFPRKTAEKVEDEAEEVPDQGNYRAQLQRILLDLPPAGFERLCQRLLRECGFQQVNVTGRSGDGGIDGQGVVQVNPFVSFHVLFQCKRYKDAVSSGHIRDFRGAMMGRVDKGIILTTGTFTPDARKEASRDGAPPIELVDGGKIIDLFEQLRLGLNERKTYEVDEKFFEEFRK
ncbi:MAG TPA: restriction endonuclease [Terriglobia bacterium]|nr:restriction endonuclease [Terriglobia bacterium]